jgi:hypothetical protein
VVQLRGFRDQSDITAQPIRRSGTASFDASVAASSNVAIAEVSR